MDYEDLRIRIEAGDGEVYKVRAERPDGSSESGEFVKPLNDDQLENFILRVGMPRRRVRSWSSSQIEQARRVGGRLFGALMRDDIGRAYVDARAAAEARRRGLRLTLVLTDAPALMRLPWEYLYERTGFLAQSLETLVVRGLDVPRARAAEPVTFPLRILAMVSNPRGVDELDAPAERSKLERALEPLIVRGVVDLRWLERATLSALELALATGGGVHVLHYIGHGTYDPHSGTGALAFEYDDESVRLVAGGDLCALLGDQRPLRLVVLNSCEGARTSAADPFSGVATKLVECRIPAVVGMQFEITDDAAVTFGERLYTALATGLPIDEAVVATRKAIFAAGHEAEFGTPVLYLAPGRSQLFDVAEPLAPDPPRDTLGPPIGLGGALGLRLKLELEMHGALAPGATFEALVDVSTADHTTSMRSATLDVLAVVDTSEHFERLGPPAQPLRLVDGKLASGPLRVELKVRETLARNTEAFVAVDLYYEGRPLTSVRRLLTLEAAGQRPAGDRVIGASGAAVRLEIDTVAPDMTVQILRAGVDGWTCRVSSPLLEELFVPEPRPWSLTRPISGLVDQYVRLFVAHGASRRQRRDALVAAGRAFFRASPGSFQQAFWTLLDAGLPLRSILVVTDEPEFPWELLIPHRGEESCPPLGVKYAVGRWLGAEDAAPPQLLSLTEPLVLAPSTTAPGWHPLAHSKDEADLVTATLGGRQLSPVTYEALDDALMRETAGMIHFVGHGRRDAQGAALLLDGSEPLHELQLEGMPGLAAALRRDRPLIFLNAAEVGRPTTSSDVGMVRSLLRMGASAVIAPTWPVRDDIAYAAAQHFYTSLRTDPQRQFADILREMRSRAYEGDEPEDTWASYTFFGDPLAARAV